MCYRAFPCVAQCVCVELKVRDVVPRYKPVMIWVLQLNRCPSCSSAFILVKKEPLHVAAQAYRLSNMTTRAWIVY